MLSIQIDHHGYAIPAEQVQHVDYVESLTPLPFIRPPIEGLTRFKQQPVIQIDLAKALGITNNNGHKRLLLNTHSGTIALRISDILNFDHSRTPKDTLPLLQLSTLLPWTACQRVILTKPELNPITPITNNKTNDSLTVLLVKSGDIIIALSTDNIDHIQELLDLPKNSDNDILIKIKQALLPVRSLTQLYSNTRNCNESIAIIVRHESNPWALLVEQVLGLNKVTQVYHSNNDGSDLYPLTQVTQIQTLLNTASAESPVWYISSTGQVQTLMNANALINRVCKPLAIQVIEPQAIESNPPLSLSNTRRENEGLQIHCGTNSYLLPLALVKRTLNDLNNALGTRQRFLTQDRSDRYRRLPLINASALLSGKLCLTKTRCVLLLSLPNKAQVLFNVNQALLCLPTATWLALQLPQPIALLFDGASYDNHSQQWILRINSTFDFCFLPYSLKKAIVRNILGWFDQRTIDELL